MGPFGAQFWRFPGAVVRLDPGKNPPATALAEIYEPPLRGYSPRGMDRTATVWSGRRSRAVIWRASTGASARPPERAHGNRTALSRRLTCIRFPVPSLLELARQGRPRRPTTPGWISSHLWSGQGRAVCNRQRERGPSSAGGRTVWSLRSPPRRASSPRAWMGGLMIRMQAVKGGASGSCMARARRFIWRAAKAW